PPPTLPPFPYTTLFRSYLFSNAVPPMICAAGLKALELIRQGDELRRRLEENARFFRQALEKLGFKVRPGTHPIMPVILGDAALRSEEHTSELQSPDHLV